MEPLNESMTILLLQVTQNFVFEVLSGIASKLCGKKLVFRYKVTLMTFLDIYIHAVHWKQQSKSVSKDVVYM